MSRIYAILAALGLALAVLVGAAKAEEKKAEKKADEKAAETDTAKVKVSKQFLDRWKRIDEMTKQKREFEAKKATTVAGVRGAEAEDTAQKELYYRGGTRSPSRLELKSAIKMLQESIEADPKGEGVAEAKYFIADCFAQLGNKEEARKYYEDVVKNHEGTKWAKQAKEDLANIKKAE